MHDRQDDRTGDLLMLSILVPAYNAAETIGQTIRSVFCQKGVELELIIVDDGSTDDTVKVIYETAGDDCRVRLIQQENQGTGGALKTAAAHAHGQWLLILGADDYLLGDVLAGKMSFVCNCPGYDIYASDIYHLYEDGTTDSHPNWGCVRSVTLEDMIQASCISGGFTLFRKTVYDRVGGFRTQFHNEDYDLWLRMLAQNATHVYQPEPLGCYRVHGHQKTADIIKLRTDDIAILDDLINSGLLSGSQKRLAQRVIAKHKRNIRIRKSLYKLTGKQTTERLVGRFRK
jgi:glycosyltransferase involved in cell wall biosynthesis